jgi:hypothetical protein
MSTVASKRENVPAKVKVAIQYLLEVKDDLRAAAEHAGIALVELRRSMGRPQVRRYSLEQRQLALERFCLRSPAVLSKVVDESQNSMAIVQAVRAGEILRVGAVEAEAAAARRAPGLQIVVLQNDGTSRVAFQPPQPRPMLDVSPKPEPVPAMPSDVDAE